MEIIVGIGFVMSFLSGLLLGTHMQFKKEDISKKNKEESDTNNELLNIDDKSQQIINEWLNGGDKNA